MKPQDESPLDLDELLSLGPVDGANRELRGALLSRTSKLLTRRRIAGRAIWAAALIGVYLAGLSTAMLWRSAGDASWNNPAAIVHQPADAEQTEPEQVEPEADRPENRKQNPTIIAQRPTEPLSRFESLSALGDRYLTQRRDPQAATRCYRLALRYASPEERQYASTQGSWLLRALYQDRSLSQPMEPDHENDPRSS